MLSIDKPFCPRNTVGYNRRIRFSSRVFRPVKGQIGMVCPSEFGNNVFIHSYDRRTEHSSFSYRRKDGSKIFADRVRQIWTLNIFFPSSTTSFLSKQSRFVPRFKNCIWMRLHDIEKHGAILRSVFWTMY